jgi:hypothetical protein
VPEEPRRPQLPGGRLPCGKPLRYLDAEWADVAGVNLERRTQPGRRLHVCGGEIGGVNLLQPLVGEGMHAGAEKRPHLPSGDRIPRGKAINAGHTGADPGARSFSAFGVVGGQPDMTLLGSVQCCDLPGQIVVPRPGAQLVDAHRHTH